MHYLLPLHSALAGEGGLKNLLQSAFQPTGIYAPPGWREVSRRPCVHRRSLF